MLACMAMLEEMESWHLAYEPILVGRLEVCFPILSVKTHHKYSFLRRFEE